MNDFKFQTQYIIDQRERLLWLQDQDPLSPSHGSFHYAYWRDKTSEFPDCRFQEAGATLGLLCHPLFADRIKNTEILQKASLDSLSFLGRFQHLDGSYDEWYKHEHGFAVTAFTSIAYGLLVNFCPNNFTGDSLAKYKENQKRAGKWLLKNDDLVKINHQMAGAAALALIGKNLNDQFFLEGAKKKFDKGVRTQMADGWFQEVAGMDLGYCSVLLDYAMLYHKITSDSEVIAPMKKLLKFMLPHIHPDMTISAEAGLCLNPYVSRLGLVLLAPYSTEALSLVKSLDTFSPGVDGIRPYIFDDLRLSRWGYLPLVTEIILESSRKTLNLKDSPGHISLQPVGGTVSQSTKIVSFKAENYHSTFCPVGGGVVRVKDVDRKFTFEDKGYYYNDNGTKLGVLGYNDERKLASLSDNSFSSTMTFSPPSFFYPGFLSRLVLRLGGSIPGMSKWLRKGIDLYRKINKTAINQSAAPVSNSKVKFSVERTVKYDPDQVQIDDHLFCRPGDELRLDQIEMNVSINQHNLNSALDCGAETCKSLKIRKIYDITSGVCITKIIG